MMASCRKDSTPVVTVDVLPGTLPPAPAAISQFSVPFEYDFSAIIDVIDRAVPTRFGSLDSVRQVGTDSRRHYAFEADRGPFTAVANGSSLYLTATLAYSAKGYYKPPVAPTIAAGCGTKGERPRISIVLSTPVALTANWQLKAQTRLDNVAPASMEQRDRCDVSILRRDVTDRILEAARNGISNHLDDVDRKIGEVNLKGRFSQWWNMLARPIRLTDGVWLLLNPEHLAIGAISGKDHVLRVPVTLTARPQIVTSATKPIVPTAKLPPLGQTGTAKGFRVILDGTIDYETASRVVATALVNKRLTQSGRSVTVKAVRIAPTDKGRLTLAVDFTGDARGTLLFHGNPALDTARHQVTVPDLDYALDTDNQILASYAWLRSDELRAIFRDKARFPFDSVLRRGRSLLLSGLNRKLGDALTLSATVDDVAVRGLYVTRDGLIVRAEARGRARARVRQR